MRLEITQGLSLAGADVLAKCSRASAANEQSPRHELVWTTEHVLTADDRIW